MPVGELGKSKLTSSIPNFAGLLERTLSPYDDRSLRVPFYLTSTDREINGKSGVSMLMNPTQVTFRQTKRITVRDTQGGKVYVHWTNSKGRNNDVLEMEFSGQTGNINLRSSTAQSGISNFVKDKTGRDPLKWFNNLAKESSQNDLNSLGVAIEGNSYAASGAAKLANFHNLYSLTREPVINSDGYPIRYYICYSSPLFGSTFVNFIGHFTRVLDFTDDANNPFNKFYSFGFTVLDSYPPLDELYGEITQNLSRDYLNPLG